jgi:microcystin degradation protein MlrC
VSGRGITDIGRTALFEVENVKIVLMAHGSYAVNQPILYTHLGLRIEDAKMVVLKTGSNFQYFEPWRKKLIRADTPGTTQSDLTALQWKKLPRPIYPLDQVSDWKPEVLTPD